MPVLVLCPGILIVVDHSPDPSPIRFGDASSLQWTREK